MSDQLSCCTATDTGIELGVRRRKSQSAQLDCCNSAVANSVEVLLAFAESRRNAIVQYLQSGQRGIGVQAIKAIASFHRGETPHGFPPPRLEWLWNSARALGLPNVPPWPGEPADCPSALDRLDILIVWLRQQAAAASQFCRLPSLNELLPPA
jgi:hypothetical protein